KGGEARHMRKSKDANLSSFNTATSFGTAMGIAALTAAILTAASAGAQDAARITPSPAFTPEQLSAPPTDAWITNGGSTWNQRYSPLDQITRENVSQLKAVRRLSMEGSGLGARTSGQGQPLYYDGVLYSVTGENDVFAHDVDTGEILWSYRAN